MPRPLIAPVRRPTVLAAAGGLAAVVVLIAAGGEVGPVPGARPYSNWWDLLDVSVGSGGPDPTAGRLLLASIIALCVAWLVLFRSAAHGRLPERWTWIIAGLWWTPLLAAPPLLSGDVYSYTAQAELLHHGLNPYRVGPAALGPGPVLAAVDPRWRHTLTPYGPVAVGAERLAGGLVGGRPLALLILLRLLPVLAVIAAGLLARRMVAPGDRAPALAVLLLSPLVVGQVISAGHIDGLMVLALLASMVAAQRGHWASALAAASVAGAVKAPGLAAVLILLCAHFAVAGHGRARLRAMLRDAAVLAGSWAVFALLVPDAFGWLRALGTPGKSLTVAAPSTLVAGLISVATGGDYLHPEPQLLQAARAAGLVAAAAVVITLAVTVRRRRLEHSVGYALIGVALLSPVLYPWYLLWGLSCLALRPRERPTVLAIVATAGVLLALPGLHTELRDIELVATGAAVVVLLAWTTVLRIGRFADDWADDRVP